MSSDPLLTGGPMQTDEKNGQGASTGDGRVAPAAAAVPPTRVVVGGARPRPHRPTFDKLVARAKEIWGEVALFLKKVWLARAYLRREVLSYKDHQDYLQAT